MVLGLLAATLSVLIGTVLGLVRGSKPAARGLRTFAVVSAVCLVLGRIVPDALTAVGLPVLVVVGLAFVLPAILERTGRRLLPSGKGPAGKEPGAGESRWVLELSFFGLLLHKVGDGIGIGTYVTGAHADHVHWEVHAAIAAHTVPITAVVVGALATKVGRGRAIARAAVLAAAAALGVLAVDTLLVDWVARWEPWILAAVGGLLLHVVAHSHAEEAREHDACHAPPRGMSWPEVVGAAAGVSVLWLGGAHHHHGVDGDPALLATQAFFDLMLESSPALLAGLLVGAALQLWGSKIPMAWLRGGSVIGQSLRGALVGIPIPICSCGVLPVVESLRRRGASAAVVASFLIAAPELGVETFALTVRFFSWEFALLRLVAAIVVALVTAVALAAAVRRNRAGIGEADAAHNSPVVTSGEGSGWTRFWNQFDDLLAHIGPWTLLGLVVAAYTTLAVHGQPAGALSTGSFAGDLAIVTVLAIPSYVCAASATPLAAVLVAEGFSPGAALVGLLLGPATNIATFGYLAREFGGRATLSAIGALLVTGWGLAYATNGALAEQPAFTVPVGHAHQASWWAYASALLLVFAILVSLFRRGLGAWFGALSPGGFDAVHDHAGQSA